MIVKKYLINLEGRLPVPKKAVNALRKKIMAYSAIKIKANPPDPYSTLNPDTNSDSPSEKSKGVRLVSAKQEITHNKIIIGLKINNEI